MAGTATAEGTNGTDIYLLYNGILPYYYVNIKQALDMGWNPAKKNLYQTTGGKRIGGDIYYNSAGKLPDEDGRIWYTSDINFTKDDRGLHRIVYSNDGLILGNGAKRAHRIFSA